MKLWNGIREMDWYRRILLGILLLGAVGFGIRNARACSRLGLAYGNNGLLVFTQEEDGLRCYSGRVDGNELSFRTRDGIEVEYIWNGELSAVYQVLQDPTAAPTALGNLNDTGVEILRDGVRVFRGGYDAQIPILVDEDGTPCWDGAFSWSTGEGNTAEAESPSLLAVVQVALGPPLPHRGSWSYYGLFTVLAAAVAADIIFWRRLFRRRMYFTVEDPEAAEPSEWYRFSAYASMLILTGMVLAGYWMVTGGIGS